ncbi:myb/SANT-like DNA-binding domain-containing protein 3 isoform X2 [Homarus americanus]|uniref:myb/SANT-like DNA-binding domain-containing protein 3 isoform X2 n=1 Tax=Homarus americanus TaxID=6706 RepID=UPI001C47DC18|nr:myb/SANT-like DNA-binding domain-containing protein 3 isoform X2 [Homarus americanus]
MANVNTKAVPLSEKQRQDLVALIKDREATLTSKVSNPHLPEERFQAWQDITCLFNADNPGQDPRTVKQLKRCWEHIKRKAKKVKASNKQETMKMDDGTPPQEEDEETNKVFNIIADELGDFGNEFDSDARESGEHELTIRIKEAQLREIELGIKLKVEALKNTDLERKVLEAKLVAFRKMADAADEVKSAATIVQAAAFKSID